MLSKEELNQAIETNPNTLTISRSHVSCDLSVEIPEELYLQYERGNIDRDTFEEEIDCYFGNDKYTTYEVNYFYKEDFSEMVDVFIEEMKMKPYEDALRQARDEAEEARKEVLDNAHRIEMLETELAMLKQG